MSTSSIKPTNHRVYPCPNDKKISLLNQLIKENRDIKIVVVTSQDASTIKESLVDAASVEVLNDEALFRDETLKCDLLISLDLPQKAILYTKRLSHTTSKALLILNESEQKLLYPIETLLGRTIKQETIKGFEYEKIEKKEAKPKQKQMSKQDIKDVAKKRYDEGTRESKTPQSDKKSDKPKRDDAKAKQWEKKKKPPNKFLGKDADGKAIFSGKSGERNHRHDGTPKEKYSAPKKVGKKINIKSLKKPQDKKEE